MPNRQEQARDASRLGRGADGGWHRAGRRCSGAALCYVCRARPGKYWGSVPNRFHSDFSMLAYQNTGVTPRALSAPPAPKVHGPEDEALRTRIAPPSLGSLSEKLSLQEGRTLHAENALLWERKPASHADRAPRSRANATHATGPNQPSHRCVTISRVAHAAGERPALFCVVRPVVRRLERLDTLRVEQAGDIAAAPHMRPGFAVQRDRVPVRCSPFVESIRERVHICHPLTGPHDPDVQMFRHVVIVTRSPAHPGPAGGVSKDARIEWPGHTVSAGRSMRTILARRACDSS